MRKLPGWICQMSETIADANERLAGTDLRFIPVRVLPIMMTCCFFLDPRHAGDSGHLRQHVV